jgi:hypothetical protein
MPEYWNTGVLEQWGERTPGYWSPKRQKISLFMKDPIFQYSMIPFFPFF